MYQSKIADKQIDGFFEALSVLETKEEYYRFFEKEHNFNFGLQVSTLAKKTLGISYAEAEEFALSVYRQYILSLPNENIKLITEKVVRDWQSQVIVPHNAEKGVEDTCLTDL